MERNFKALSYKFDVSVPTKSIHLNKIAFHSANIVYIKNNYFFSIGRKKLRNNIDKLSSGSLIESSNSLGIPKIILGINNYKQVDILQKKFFLKAHFEHGWLDKSSYIKAPYIHGKSLIIKKEFAGSNSFNFGLFHMAIWGGETVQFGKQPDSFIDYLRIIFVRPGSNKSLLQESNNKLGNHLGVWTLGFEKKFRNLYTSLSYEHPFEDESSARWLLNKFDGKYKIEVHNLSSKILSKFVYEYINTMNQSGSLGASDSTYGWDNYFNHYLYQSGWTYKEKIIGNPLFTLGNNYGRYSNVNYIINNRIIAHHFAMSGKLNKIKFRFLFTNSKNYGNYPDKDFYKRMNEFYLFENGISQNSMLLELKYHINLLNIEILTAYAKDYGKLLPKTDSFMMVINYKL